MIEEFRYVQLFRDPDFLSCSQPLDDLKQMPHQDYRSQLKPGKFCIMLRRDLFL